ncbi:hypothetical protein MRX96_023369 [Rhipicephalus microplus]
MADSPLHLFKSGEDPVRSAQQKNGGRAPKNAANRPPKNAPTFRTVPRTEVATSPEALRTVLSKLVETGCQESLEWLLSSLEDALEDWDPEDPSSVPLVPILEAHHSSMENGDFCSLLRTMGIQPPADEQEAYWRIPADMTTTMLNSRVTVVKKALEGDYGAPLLVVDREAAATNERIPKEKLKHREALQALLEKKRTRQDDSSGTDSDEVGFARRDQRKRKKPRTRDTREAERTCPQRRLPKNGDGGRTPPSPSTMAEPIRKRKRATLVVDSDEERESSKRAELVGVDSEEDTGALVIADDETASRAGRAAKGGRLVVLDDSDDEDVVVKSSGAVTDRGVENGDAVSNDASRDVIDLDGESGLSDRRRRRSSGSLTGSDSFEGSRVTPLESRKESPAVVEDGGSGSDADDAPQ